MQTIFTSRQFNHEVGKAKKNAQLNGAVLITDRGETTHVLLSIAEYKQLTQSTNIVDALSMPGLSMIDFEPERLPLFSQERELF